MLVDVLSTPITSWGLAVETAVDDGRTVIAALNQVSAPAGALSNSAVATQAKRRQEFLKKMFMFFNAPYARYFSEINRLKMVKTGKTEATD